MIKTIATEENEGSCKKRGAFNFHNLLRSFKKSSKRNSLAQAHLEYIIIMCVIASLTLLSLTTFIGKFDENTGVPTGGICKIVEDAFQRIVDRMIDPQKPFVEDAAKSSTYEDGHKEARIRRVED